MGLGWVATAVGLLFDLDWCVELYNLLCYDQKQTDIGPIDL